MTKMFYSILTLVCAVVLLPASVLVKKQGEEEFAPEKKIMEWVHC